MISEVSCGTEDWNKTRISVHPVQLLWYNYSTVYEF